MRIGRQQLEAIKRIYFDKLNEVADQTRKEAAKKNAKMIKSEKALVNEITKEIVRLKKLESAAMSKLEKLKRTDIQLSEWYNKDWEYFETQLLLGAASLDKLEAMIAEAVKKAVK